MNRSENIGQLAAALAAAQSKFRPVTKDRMASIQSQKGSFKYQYADLATVVTAIKDALAANNLAIMQPVHMEPNVVMVTTMLAHGSGEWISEVMTWPVASTDNRSIGSGITYARRHSLLAMVGGAATDEDDDAEQARGGDHETARPPPHRKPDPAPNHPPASDHKPAGLAPHETLWTDIKTFLQGDEAATKAVIVKAATELWGEKVPPKATWTPKDCAELKKMITTTPF
jgi:hypothetical protein